MCLCEGGRRTRGVTNRTVSLELILFKACSKCGGELDTTYRDDVSCVQCGDRPDILALPPSAVSRPLKPSLPATADTTIVRECPRCATEDAVELEKLRSIDNTCYRCRRCGQIFSPAPARPRDQSWSGRSA